MLGFDRCICDAIKQNEYELGKKIETQFSFSLYAPISELYHAENPHLNWRYGSKDIAI